MKNLSIEEKAKRYDEAIKRAKELLEIGVKDTRDKRVVLSFFPELKEPEDEKIRKEIIKLVKFFYGSSLVCKHTISKDKMVAWLEKQGDNTYNKELSELLHKVICRFINDPDIPYFDREKVSMKVLPYVEQLEKQGEQKSQGKSALEAINEEDAGNANKIDDYSIDSHYFGTIDKAEPKSEIIKDTWYVCTCTTCTEDSRIWFNKGIAYLGNDILKYDLGFEPEEYQGYFRLWTIKDARWGDVLAFDDNIIVIFKDLYNDTTFHSYCHIENDVLNISQVDMPDWWESKGFHPATKEQCDLFFQKMKEKGYKWNDNTKEVIKL